MSPPINHSRLPTISLTTASASIAFVLAIIALSSTLKKKRSSSSPSATAKTSTARLSYFPQNLQELVYNSSVYNPNFTITNSILANIGLIEAAKALIDASPLLPSWEKRFQDEAIVRTVHHGTHLEGNELDLSEAKRILEGENVVARPRDVQEVINYRNVIEFIGKSKRAPNEELLRQLHKLTTERILPADEAGHYREKSVVVRNSRTGEVSFRPPPPVEIPHQIRAFLQWLAQETTAHPVLRSGIAHYELARIHPFVDGNGRVARAATMLVLYNAGYDIRRFFSLEEHYDKNAEAYYKALQSVSSGDYQSPRRAADNIRHYNLTPWLEYFVEGLAVEFTRVKEKVAKISRDLNLKNTLGGQIYLNDRQLKIIEHVQEVGFLQNKQFSRLFPDLSDDTILRELNDLLKKNIVKKKGKTKAARYVLA